MDILILLAPVTRGSEAQLRDALAAIEADHAGNAYLRLGSSPNTHFVRFVLLEDDEHGVRLLFAANYDGPLGAYLDELRRAGPGLDRIFGACAGYDRDLAAFARRWYLKPRGVYIAFPGVTVRDVRRWIAVREQIESFLDLPEVAGYLTEPGIGPLLEQLVEIRDTAPGDALYEGLRASVANCGGAVRGVVLKQFLRIAEGFSKHGQATTWPLVRGGFDDGTYDREREQAIQTVEIGAGSIQNQMTTVTEIRPELRLRLRVALAGTTVLSRFGWPPGEFADVGTLHWFAWALLDDGKRLLFMSTFDGSWQNYLQDFINKLIWALDALYSNTYDYPAAGMQDIWAFTDYILDHQRPPAVFYSAYPTETVFNALRDRQIASAVGLASRRPQLDGWLGAL